MRPAPFADRNTCTINLWAFNGSQNITEHFRDVSFTCQLKGKEDLTATIHYRAQWNATYVENKRKRVIYTAFMEMELKKKEKIEELCDKG
jgi:hypothetical protein